MGKNKEKKAKDPNKLGFGRLMAFKSSDISAAWINLIVLNYLSIYASDTLGVGVATVGTLLMVSKLFDGVTDIFAGWLIDNTHTKIGKGRPYELCILGMTVCTILLFSGNPNWSSTLKCVWIFCMYTFTFSVFSTLRNAAATPYTIRHFSNNPILIRKVASYGGIITMAGSMAMSIAFPTLMAMFATSASGWSSLILVLMIAASAIGVFRFLLCKEDPAVDAGQSHEPIHLKEIFTLFAKNKYVWIYALIMLCYNVCTNLAVGSYYFKYIIGNVAMQSVVSVFSVVLLPLMLVYPKIMAKIGSMGKMIFYFALVGVVGYIICFFSGAFLGGVLIGTLLGTFATMPLAYYGVLFIMNICSYNEMIGLKRMEGSSNILSNFASKVGSAAGAYITGILLALGGYVSESGVTTQSASALMMIRIDYAIVPAILLVVIAFGALAFSRLEVKVNEYNAQKALAAQEAAAGTSAE